MKLFLLTTTGLGDFYLIADTPNDAENALINYLNKADYGFNNLRSLTR